MSKEESVFGVPPLYPSLPSNPLYTHLTPDTPQHSHTLSSQVLAAADLSTNTCWGELNLWTSGWKNTSAEEREDIRGGGGGGGGWWRRRWWWWGACVTIRLQTTHNCKLTHWCHLINLLSPDIFLFWHPIGFGCWETFQNPLDEKKKKTWWYSYKQHCFTMVTLKEVGI